jgi:histidinol-phosphate/aromatic aminotransferase/cobyric acid decarboxylase-like protein
MSSSPEARAHGGLLDRELAALGLRASDVLDVSVNVNPYGPCPAVVQAIRAAPLDRYPDPTAWAAREAIGRGIGESAERVVLGNGAVDLLWTLARAFIAPGRAAVVVEPAFSEFAAAVTAAGGRVVPVRARPEDGFAVDLAAVERAARVSEAALVYLCTPANPTGVAVDPGAVARAAAASPSSLAVVDESFLALSDRAADERAPMPPNVVRVRSMTKTHALPGVRLGYAVAREDVAARLERARPPWTTSAIAQAAARAAIAESAFVESSRERVLADRVRLSARLRELGFAPRASSTLYFLLPVCDASGLRARLLARHRVLVRDATSFGLPGFVRVCATPERDDDRLLTALLAEAAP